jgi:hypothetical protein
VPILLSLQGMAPDLEVRATGSAVGKGPRLGLKAKTWCVLTPPVAVARWG